MAPGNTVDDISHNTSKDDAQAMKLHDKIRGFSEISQEELRSGYHIPRELKYIARRYGIEDSHVTEICRQLRSNETEQATKIGLSYSLKYAIEKGDKVSFEELFDVLENNQDARIKSQIIWTLGCKIQSTQVAIDQEVLGRLRYYENDTAIDKGAIRFLNAKIKQHQDLDHAEDLSSLSTIKIASSALSSKPQAVVTKDQHTTKTVHKKHHSDEEQIKIADFEVLITKTKTAKSRAREKEPDAPEENGSDLRWYNTMYDSVLKIYNSKKVKTEDIRYVIDQFFSPSWWNGSVSNHGISKILFTQRMMAAILCRLCEKQKLSPQFQTSVLKQLFLCIDTIDNIKKRLFGSGSANSKAFAARFNCGDIYNDQYEGTVQIVRDAAIRIRNCLKIDRGTFWNSAEVSNSKKLVEEVEAELSAIRVDATKAIYHLYLRNKSTINPERMKQLESFLGHKDSDSKFSGVIIKILRNNDQHNYKTLFDQCLARLEDSKLWGEEDFEDSITYIEEQTKDAIRYKELFTASVISRIGNLLNSKLDQEKKAQCCSVINGYLENGFALNDQHLEMWLKVLNHTTSDRTSDNLREELLKSILYTATTSQRLPKSAIDVLVKNIESFSQKSQALIIIALGKICDNTQVCNLDAIAFQLNNYATQEDLIDTVLTSVESDHTFSTISAITSKIFISSMLKGSKISTASLERLVDVINTDGDDSKTKGHKQARILSSRALTLALRDTDIRSDSLFKLIPHMNDNVHDVSVHTIVAYTKGVSKLSTNPDERIAFTHLETLKNNYVFGELRLEDKDFAREINEHILSTFLSEAVKQRFEDENIFRIFDFILLNCADGHEKALEILEVYISTHHFLPQKTIDTLENGLGIPEIQSKVYYVLQLAIKSQVVVGEKTINRITDDIDSEDSESKANALELFEQLEQNDEQDLTREMLETLKTARAERSIVNEESDKEGAISYLRERTKQGHSLPLSTLRCLKDSLQNTSVLSILENLIEHKYGIPGDVVKVLESDFGTSSNKKTLISIFRNMLVTNQCISEAMLSELEMTLKDDELREQALSIFVLQAQRGITLSQNVIKQLFNAFLDDANATRKQEVFTAICAIIKNAHAAKFKSTQFIPSVHKIVVAALVSNEIGIINIIKENIVGLKSIVSKHPLSKKQTGFLASFANSQSCNPTLHEMIYQIINHAHLTEVQKAHYTLATISSNSDEEYLGKITDISKRFGLLEQNFARLCQIINSCSALKEEVLKILVACPNKKEMPSSLIAAVQLLSESTNLLNIRDLCDKLIKHPSVKIKLSRTLDQEFYNAKASYSAPRAQDIERAVLSQNISFDAMTAYSELVRNPEYITSSTAEAIIRITDQLSEFIVTSDDSKLNLVIFKCIAFLSRSGAMVLYKAQQILENILISNDDVELKSVAFKALRAIVNKGCVSEVFSTFCADTYANFKKSIEKFASNTDLTQYENLDLLETLISLEYIDIKFIAKTPKSEWTKELIITDILARAKAPKRSQFVFRMDWSVVEKVERFGNGESDKILVLLHENYITHRLTYEELETLVKALPTELEISAKEIQDILSTSLHPCFDICALYNVVLLQPLLSRQDVNSEYVQKLATIITSKLSLKNSIQLLQIIKEIDNLQEFHDLLNFISSHHINLSDISFAQASVNELKNALEIEYLHSTLDIRNDKLSTLLRTTIVNLLRKDWTFKMLHEIFEVFLSGHHADTAKKNLIHILEVINQYNLSVTNIEKIKDILLKLHVDWLQEINCVMNASKFRAKTVKDTSALIDEFKESNLGNSNLNDLTHHDILSELVSRIKNAVLHSTIDTHSTEPISKWKVQDIGHWATEVRAYLKGDHAKFKTDDFIVEALAVARKAVLLDSNIHLTDAQILSAIVMLRTNQDQKVHGRLLQVATGEGKSTIISIAAIINALNGQKVDIITSSSVLATRDAKEKSKLYKMFGLSCDDNNDKAVYITGRKACYKKDIVYGDGSQFQFDTLRDEYSGLKTLSDRKCDVAIIDEVDSMLIDDGAKIARLASSVAGMDQLQLLYHYLWQELNNCRDHVISIDGKIYFFEGKLSHGIDEITLTHQDPAKSVDDLKNYIESTNGHVGDIGGVLIEGDERLFVTKHITNHIKQLIEDKKHFIIEGYLEEFVEMQLPKWVDSAILALNYSEGIHYVIQDGAIKPVDYDSTGIVQSATNWSDGLHQFLQLKHNLALTSETITTNFLSNIGYIKRYKSNIFGLTATLGSTNAKIALSETYGVDFVYIPQSYKKQYIELPETALDTTADWVSEICRSSVNEAKKGRGVLIICNTIDASQSIAKALRTVHRSVLIKLYTMNDMNQEQEIEKIEPGEVIVATNLAGRGTDIKTESIEAQGGMHVIMTYMPLNQRVEDQGFGRTSRQGKKGTGQLILNKTTLLEYDYTRPIKEQRDEIEAQKLNREREELKIIDKKDELFRKFCALKRKIALQLKSTPDYYKNNIVASVEEEWAMFLYKVNNGRIALENANEEYKVFEERVLKDLKQKTSTKNPYHHIAIANGFLLEGKHSEAEEHINEAIRLGKDQCPAAYAAKAWYILAIRKDKQQYKKEAIEYFQKACDIVAEEISRIGAIFALQKNPNSNLAKQIKQKQSILHAYLSGIESSISAIKKSQRLIDVVATKSYQKKESSDSAYDANVSKIGILCQGLVRNKDGSVDIRTLEKYEQFEVRFNDLTSMEDIVTKDQAIQTISGASTVLSSLLRPNYSEIALEIGPLCSEQIQDLLNHDVIKTDLTKESALDILKNRNGWFGNYLQDKRIAEATEVLIEVIAGAKTNKHEKLSIENAIKVIETQGENTRFNLNFVSANPIAKKLSSEIIGRSTTLNIEFSQQTSQEYLSKLQQVECKDVDIKISGSPENLKSIIKKIGNADAIKIISSVSQTSSTKSTTVETLYNDSAIQKLEVLEKASSDEVTVEICSLNKKDAIRLVQLCSEDISIDNLRVHEVSTASVIKIVDDQTRVRVSVEGLNQKKSELLIPELRQNHFNFSLIFKGLDCSQVSGVIEKASIAQEEMEDLKTKSLDSIFLHESTPALELSEFTERGIEYIFDLNEKRFIPWNSIAAVSLLAAAQIAVGTALVCTGFGATVGIGFITEGAADVISAYRAYSTRQFSVESYLKQKAVSLAISAVSMGWSAMKDAAKGTKALVSGVAQEALEQAGTQVVTNGKAIGQALKETGTNLYKYTGGVVATKLSEAAGREIVNQGFDFVSRKSLEYLTPQISQYVQTKVMLKFADTSKLANLIKKIYAVDSIDGKRQLDARIQRVVVDLINPEHHFWRKQWDSVASPLLRGILGDQKFAGLAATSAFRVYGILSGIKEIVYIVSEVHDQLFTKLTGFDRDTASMTQLLIKHCALERSDASEIIGILVENKILDNEDALVLESFTASGALVKSASVVNFDKHDKHKKKVLDFLKLLYTKICAQSIDNLESIMKSVSDLITNQIIRVTESQIISPITTLVASQIVDYASTKAQNAIIKRLDKDRASKWDEALKELENKKDKTAEDKKNIEYLKSGITFTKATEQLAREYGITRSQCEIIFFAKNGKDSSAANEKVTKRAADIRDANSVASLAEMVITIEKNGPKAKMVDQHYTPTEEDIASGTILICYQSGGYDEASKKDQIGHYVIMEHDGSAREVSGTNGSCGYDVIASLTGKTSKDLREEVASYIEANVSSFAEVINVESWVQDRHLEAANTLLFRGGSKSTNKWQYGQNLLDKNSTDSDDSDDDGTYNPSRKFYKQLRRNIKLRAATTGLINSNIQIFNTALQMQQGFTIKDGKIIYTFPLLQNPLQNPNFFNAFNAYDKFKWLDANSPFMNPLSASKRNDVNFNSTPLLSQYSMYSMRIDPISGEIVNTRPLFFTMEQIQFLGAMNGNDVVTSRITHSHESERQSSNADDFLSYAKCVDKKLEIAEYIVIGATVVCAFCPPAYPALPFLAKGLAELKAVRIAGHVTRGSVRAVVKKEAPVNELFDIVFSVFAHKIPIKQLSTSALKRVGKCVPTKVRKKMVKATYQLSLKAREKLAEMTSKEVVKKLRKEVPGQMGKLCTKGAKKAICPPVKGFDKCANNMLTAEPDNKDEEQHLEGTYYHNYTQIPTIHSIFSTYTLSALDNILGLRVKTDGLRNTVILKNHYIFEGDDNIDMLISSVGKYALAEDIAQDTLIILVPINLNNKHAVGVMLVVTEEKTLAYYIDPSNEAIPHQLKDKLCESAIDIEVLQTEGQKYTNCGPEVIENFMLYLTGERLSQEEAIPFHSKLVEEELLSASEDRAGEDVKIIDGTAVSSSIETSSVPLGSPHMHSTLAQNIPLLVNRSSMLYDKANALVNRAFDAENDEENDRCEEAERCFAESLECYAEALSLSPQNDFYKAALKVTGLKIKANRAFGEAIELICAARDEGDEAVRLGIYGRALEALSASKESLYLAYNISRDTRFIPCIDLVDDVTANTTKECEDSSAQHNLMTLLDINEHDTEECMSDSFHVVIGSNIEYVCVI